MNWAWTLCFGRLTRFVHQLGRPQAKSLRGTKLNPPRLRLGECLNLGLRRHYNTHVRAKPPTRNAELGNPLLPPSAKPKPKIIDPKTRCLTHTQC